MNGSKAYWLLKKDNVAKAMAEGKREDGRGIDDYRDITIETGMFHHAEGSAIVTLGRTKVAAGVKLGLEVPYPDMPAQGKLVTEIEMSPMSFPMFEYGPPRPPAIELSRVVDRAFREAEVVDMSKMVIREGELVWAMFNDVQVLNYDGNLFDAASIALLAATVTARMPKVEDDKIVRGEWTNSKLPINKLATLTTFAKIGDQVVLDPGLSEDMALDSRMHVGITETGHLCALQKGGGGTFTQEETMDLLTNRSLTAAKTIFKAIKTKVKA